MSTPLVRFDPKEGRFVAASERGFQDLDALIRATVDSGDIAQHKALGATIIGPIKQVAAYQEWTNGFFQPRNIVDGEVVRIALTRPTMIALYTSTAGEVLFTRPGRKYTTIEYMSMDTGLEVGWDDLRNAGWNVMESLLVEKGEQLARKRDAAAKAVLDAAATASGHTSNSTGNVLTRAAVDLVFKSAARAGFRITKVALNSGTIMDMASWTNVSNAMWSMPENLGNQIIQNGYVTNYGGADWMAYTSISNTEVYFTASPMDCGAYNWRGDTRDASDVNIVKRTNLYAWDETNGYYVGNPYGVWKITITS